jgi:hypothetical protein
MSTGWTWDYVGEEITLPQLKDLMQYWQEYPPVHIAVLGFLGGGKKKLPLGPEVGKGNGSDLINALTALGGGTVRIEKLNG